MKPLNPKRWAIKARERRARRLKRSGATIAVPRWGRRFFYDQTLAFVRRCPL